MRLARGKRPRQKTVTGHTGSRLLNSFGPTTGDQAQARYVSPGFTAAADDVLAFFIGGGKGPDVGVELHGPDGLIRRWTGRRSERLDPVAYPLAAHAGQTLWIEVVDRDTGDWGHVLADHFLLARFIPEHEALVPAP